MTKVLLIGSGITSAVTAAILKRDLPHLHLHIWDKARGAGGRMSTCRHKSFPQYTVDLGAQYISATPDYAVRHESYYNELTQQEVLKPMNIKVAGMKPAEEGTKHYVISEGSSSLVKHFLNKASPSIRFQHHVQDISVKDDAWQVSTDSGVTETFDIVILTMPVPQIFGLKGSVQDILKNNHELVKNLNSVEYSSRYALGLFFGKGQKLSLPSDSVAEYITNHPIIRFISIDNEKRGKDDDPSSIVVHTSVPYGKAYEEKTPDEMEKPLLEKITEMFPAWPKPEYVKCQKWRYSQVSSAYPGLPGAINLADGLFFSGDAFTHSNFDGCIESAEAVSRQVTSYLETSKK